MIIYYFKSNDTFNQQLYLQNIRGTETNPVTITTYSTSNKTSFHRAIIEQNQDKDGTNSTIVCWNCEGIIISHLELSNSYFGIAIVYDNPQWTSSDAYDCLIKDNYFHNINYNVKK